MFLTQYKNIQLMDPTELLQVQVQELCVNTQSEFPQNPTTNGDTTFVDVTADTFTADNPQ